MCAGYWHASTGRVNGQAVVGTHVLQVLLLKMAVAVQWRPSVIVSDRKYAIAPQVYKKYLFTTSFGQAKAPDLIKKTEIQWNSIRLGVSKLSRGSIVRTVTKKIDSQPNRYAI